MLAKTSPSSSTIATGDGTTAATVKPVPYVALGEFYAELLRVANEDPLLNNPPKLIAASLDMAGAVSDLLGELHYSDPYLSR